jgi:protein disulfide-isomerase
MSRFCSLLLALFGIVSSASASVVWTQDAASATAHAKRDNKLVLLNFTGSDWCGWCIRLHQEVFSKPEFEGYAKKHLVPCTVDFPQQRAISATQLAKNRALADQYGVRAYPTLILINGHGKEVWRGGYRPGGPSALIGEWSSVVRSSAAAGEPNHFMRWVVGIVVALGLLVWRS